MAHLVEGNTLSQGAILDGVDWGLEPNPLSIVLTNECDFVNGNASYVIVAAIVSAKETITGSEEYKNKIEGISDSTVGKKKWEVLRNFLEKYIYNKGVTRYYFIDPADVLDAPYFFVDFQHIQSIPIDSAKYLEVIAQLPTPFKEQMMVQFASYTARIPVDRADDTTAIVDDIISPLKRNFNP